MNKELIKAFVQECKDIQDWEIRYKSNHMQMEDFFKPSGQTEKDNKDYANLIKNASQIKSNKLLIKSRKEYLTATRYKSRKEYFRKYWLEKKLNKI